MRALVIIAIIVVVLLLSIGSGYKHLVVLDESAAAQWSQVDVDLQRRFDLVPNLVATVKGYAAHEKGVFDDVANSRKAYAGAVSSDDKAKAAGQMEGALSRLLAISEAYPDLKANQNFLALQDQLEGTENRISVERQRYNDAVRDLNATLRGPFGMICNSFAHIKPREYFNPPVEARTAPTVDFSTAPAVGSSPAPTPAPASPAVPAPHP